MTAASGSKTAIDAWHSQIIRYALTEAAADSACIISELYTNSATDSRMHPQAIASRGPATTAGLLHGRGRAFHLSAVAGGEVEHIGGWRRGRAYRWLEASGGAGRAAAGPRAGHPATAVDAELLGPYFKKQMREISDSDLSIRSCMHHA